MPCYLSLKLVNRDFEKHLFWDTLIRILVYISKYVVLPLFLDIKRDDVALHGFVKRFKTASNEEREHAQKLIDYQVSFVCFL